MRTTWRDWERREDYYAEGPLLWLGIDAQIRRMRGGNKTLRDFARSFFAAGPRPLVVEPYTFSNLIATLNTVAPVSWRGYLLTRLNSHHGAYLQNDLKNAGYSLIVDATETNVFAQAEQPDGVVDLSYSIGARPLQNGVLQSVSWDGPLFKQDGPRNEEQGSRRRKRFSSNTLVNGRGGGIRTPDPLLPKQMRYQTALRPDLPIVPRVTSLP